MHPVLFTLGPITLYTYGLFLALGFIAGLYTARHEAGLLGENPDTVSDIVFYLIIFGVIGGRFFYVLTNIDTFIKNPLSVFEIWKGGLVFYGGFIFSIITVWLYTRIKKISLWKYADILAPGLAIGHAVGRIGCLMAGCCYGRECHQPWAITFHNHDSLAPLNIPLHPTQIYEVIGNLFIFAALMLFRKKKQLDGQVFWIYVFMYGVMRFIIEIFRGDDRGDYFFGVISVSQSIGILMICASVFMHFYMRRNEKK
jgi:phosphatidylglycerol:prolipoprotein diacylglycerol transferase